jgi:AcrR family transcriptional regulator
LLLQAARALFAEKGFAATTTRDIIKRAGVSDQSLFSHFGSKEGIFEAAVLAPFEEFVRRYVREWGGASRNFGDLPEMMARYVEELYALVREQRQLMRALPLEYLAHGPARAILAQVEAVARELKVAGGYAADPAIAVRGTFALVTSLALLEEQLLPGREREEIVNEITAMLVDGVSRKSC